MSVANLNHAILIVWTWRIKVVLQCICLTTRCQISKLLISVNLIVIQFLVTPDSVCDNDAHTDTFF